MENKRQAIHISMASFALLLRWLNWWQALICALIALAVNLLVMPRIGAATFREDELKRGYAPGMVYYSCSVFVMILLTPLPVAALGWAILALGDGMATIVGRKWGSAKLVWNREKSWAGMIAFMVFASIGASFFFIWCQPNVMASTILWKRESLEPILHLSVMYVVALSVMTAALAAFLETLPLGIDDNILVPLASVGFFVVLYISV